MIELWCMKKHKKQELCEECRELLTYATARLDKCKFGERKTKCHKCPVHCYRPDMREKIREVMRFSGPRMILYHPLEALRYIISKQKNEEQRELCSCFSFFLSIDISNRFSGLYVHTNQLKSGLFKQILHTYISIIKVIFILSKSVLLSLY